MKRGVYIFPSLVTLTNLSAGLVSILWASSGHFTDAAWAIIAGIIFDMMDGRVARWAGATSQFGVELDSLCDAVTFAVAPAILMYQVALTTLGRAGFAIAVFFSMAGVLRLARFNVKSHSGEAAGHFTGLPVPAAAGILASFVLSWELFGNVNITARTIPVVMQRIPAFFRLTPLIMMILAVLMVSTVRYGSFKQWKLGRPKSIQTLVLLVGGLISIFIFPQNMIFVLFCLYVLSGLIGLAVRFASAQRAKRTAPPPFGRRRTDVKDRQEQLTFSGSEPWNREK